MLTVNIREQTGHERILQVKEVRSEPPPLDGSQKSFVGDRRYFLDREDGITECVDGQSASSLYVMNDHGKTVSSYHFNVPPDTSKGVRIG